MSQDAYREAVTRTLHFEGESALEELHRDYPGLTVTSTWHGGNSGPGVTTYVGTWQGQAVVVFSISDLRRALSELPVTDPRD